MIPSSPPRGAEIEDVASFPELLVAAEELIGQCMARPVGQGGFVPVGEKHSIAILMWATGGGQDQELPLTYLEEHSRINGNTAI